MQGKRHDRVVEMRLCFFSGKVGDYKVPFKSTRKCRSTVGAQHAGREPGFRAKNRVTILHDRISLGKIEIPELHDIIPSAFGKRKGIRVKFKELGYESILIGGMTARVIR